MIKIKTIKPGKWSAFIIIVIGLLALFAGIRSMYSNLSAREVFLRQDSGTFDDSQQLVDSILRMVLDRALPAIGTERRDKNDSFFRSLIRMVTRWNYRDPKNLIVAELPIMGSYDLPFPSRGSAAGVDRGNPYDPEEDLNDILNQYKPGEIEIGTAFEGEIGEDGRQFQNPARTQLDMDQPVVLIYHTHTSEAYRPSKAYNYTPTDVDRTIDARYSVVRVGRELQEMLQSQHGIKAVHITTFHDYPEYTPAYSRSLNSVRRVMAEHPSIKVVIDLHRDAFPMRNRAEEQSARALSAIKVGGKDIAKLMLVWGPDAVNGAETRKFAELLKNKINGQCPGLCRRVLEKRTGQYNQQLSDYSALVEVGSNANTMEEALASVPYLAKAIVEAIEEIKE
ncbi:MAG: stage II sporulation protein P [Bacillota bacterium]|nr:stage II sporulation protein P [Bacillota bacterium]MDD3298161.1 stage II sporulation protein P [Bacillota bacterium]MDD3850359.1 stage II sporulation protein P [Bacillota bacterium]MDD4707951.1 stage II sporulation protein P [Bacillota bacterium]